MFKLKKINLKFGLLAFLVINIAPVLLDYFFGDKDGKIVRFYFSERIFLISSVLFITLYVINIYSKKEDYPK